MGRGTILNSLGEGLYAVRLDHGAAQKTQRLAALAVRISNAQARVVAAESIIDTYEQRVTELIAEQDAAIDALAIAPENEAEQREREVQQKTSELMTVRRALEMAQTQAKLARADLAAATSAEAALQAIDAEPELSVWCADYTEDGAGQVATIEVPGEPAETVIAPTCRPPAAADGMVTRREFQSPEQVFFNAAILPGWQRHMPTYRAGTLVSKDEDSDTGTVTLDATASSAQGLGINAVEVLNDIPITYMVCNAKAFEIGDRVLVEMGGDWSSPVVIGFVEHPRRCPWYVGHATDGLILDCADEAFEKTPELVEQYVLNGDDAVAVTAEDVLLADRLTVFRRWSDGLTARTRTEQNVTQQFYLIAEPVVFGRYLRVIAENADDVVVVSGSSPDMCSLASEAVDGHDHIYAPGTFNFTSMSFSGGAGRIMLRTTLSGEIVCEEEEAGHVLFQNADPYVGEWVWTYITPDQGFTDGGTFRQFSFSAGYPSTGWMIEERITRERQMAMLDAPATLTVRHVESEIRVVYRRMSAPPPPPFIGGMPGYFWYEIDPGTVQYP